MAHYAEIKDNIVQRVIVTDNNWTHEKTLNWLSSLSDTQWIKVSYNASIRGKFPGAGDEYIPEMDLIVSSKPFPSWVFDFESKSYIAPKLKPEGKYYWDEENQNWIEFVL